MLGGLNSVHPGLHRVHSGLSQVPTWGLIGVHPGLHGVPAYVLQPGPELLSAMELTSPTVLVLFSLHSFGHIFKFCLQVQSSKPCHSPCIYLCHGGSLKSN